MNKTIDLQILEASSDNEISEDNSFQLDEDDNLNDIPLDLQNNSEDFDDTIDESKDHTEIKSTTKKDLFSASGKSYRSLALFESIQKWKGYVTEINKDSFEARLIDQTNSGTDEIAEFSIFDIPESERNSLKIGKTFYWSIGRKEYLGQIEKTSRIHFQKVIKWDIDLVNKVKTKVDEYLKISQAN